MLKTILIIFLSMALSESIKEPEFTLISKSKDIELRNYPEYVVARTSINKANFQENNNMFRKLASYIFGSNSNNSSIPMTAPVITQNSSAGYDMIFFMLSVESPDELPKPINDSIILETMEIGKAIAISFGMKH